MSTGRGASPRQSNRPEPKSDNTKIRRSTAGASQQGVGVLQSAGSWLSHHQLVATETLLQLLSRPTASMLTWLVIAISLSLPGLLWMSLSNLSALGDSFRESGQITLYLEQGVSSERGLQMASTLKQYEEIQATVFISAEDALAEFRQHSGLAEALSLLSENPLPSAILLEPRLGISPEEARSLVKQLESQPGVDTVQLDMEWLGRLRSLLALGQQVVWILGGLLSLAILLVVGNTIRLSIAARVDEIRVIKLVGGTDAYVMRPFLYTGAWFGVVGGVLSWLILTACWLLLHGPVETLASQYGSTYSLSPISAEAALALLFFGTALGWFGAWWSVSRHIGEIEPK